MVAACAHDDGTIKFLDVFSGNTRATYKGPGDPVTSLAFNKDGSILAAAYFTKTYYACPIRLWKKPVNILRELLFRL